jgi:GNAT superfamily N-acetyltransferase
MPQREDNYDFPSWSHMGEPEATSDSYRAYLLKVDERIVGYVAAHDTNEHCRWDLADGSKYGVEDATLRPRIILIWVADAYRRRGIGAMLVQALATDFGCCAARKVIAACHAAYLYSLMRPPRIRVRRTLPVLRPCAAAGCSWASGGSWLRAWWGRCSL